MKVKNQKHESNYSIYNGDCMDVISSLDDASVDLSVYSPPFCGLYNYSSDYRDFSNCKDKQEFIEQYEYLIKEMARVTKPGRINAVHCQDIVTHTTTHNLYDFPSDVIKLHEKHGFYYRNRITIWKEPMRVRMRTMVKSLMHKQIVEDSSKCYTATPDYVLVFAKAGQNKTPITNPQGLKRYFGETPILPAMLKNYNNVNDSSFKTDYDLWQYLNVEYSDWKDHKTNKLAHFIWQRYASSVWDDIRPNNVVEFHNSREDDDEKHVHPLQLDVIDRLVELYSNEGEVVFTPFMGVGSEVYSAVSLNRKAIGAELKDSYFKQACINIDKAPNRTFEDIKQQSLF